MKIVRLFLMFIWLISPILALADGATASLDRSVTTLGESVSLHIRVEGSADQDPDLSVLKQDFDVLSQSESSNYSLINGSLSRSKTWSVMLMPKRQGILQIPSISLGNMHTQPLQLQVTAQQQSSGIQGKNVYLELSSSSQHAYVQSQIILTVKLFRAIDLAQAQLTEPDVSHAVIKRIGDDKNYETVRNQRRFIVTERRYALFPEKSGMLHIPAVQFTGQEVSQMSMFNHAGRVLRLASKGLDIKVDPIPSSWPTTQPWLPAEEVSIREIPVDHQSDSLKVGEPFTRTIEIRATGLTAEQLPQIFQHTSSANFKQYPDKPQLSNKIGKHGLVAMRREKVAMIPSKSGNLVVPAITVFWWNTKTNSIQKAVILEHMIDVKASTKLNAQPATPSAILPKVKQESVTPMVQKQVSNLSAQSEKIDIDLWQGGTLFFAIVWLLTVAIWWYVSSAKKKGLQEDKGVSEKPIHEKKYRKQLEHACQSGQAKEAMRLLLQWADCFFQDEKITSIAQLQGRSPALDSAILALEVSLYGQKSEQTWDGEGLFQAISNLQISEKESPVLGLKLLS